MAVARTIPFNRPGFVGNERAYMAEAVASGHISGDGPFTLRCQELLEREFSAPRVLLTTSCTHALELAALLLDLRPGDEVLVPDFTFVSTVNAFVLHGARPVFVDVLPDTLDLDPERLAAAAGPRARAVVPVHYAGVGCRMDTILAIAQARNLVVVEDNAHGLFGRYREKPLGSFGALAALSFHETKNFVCGEGGALVLNDERFVQRAEILREKGTNRKRFFRGEVDRYTWIDVGSSFLPSDLLAAFLLAQLEQKAKILSLRKRIFDRYTAELSHWAGRSGVTLPSVPLECTQSYHMFYLILPDSGSRGALIERLGSRSIHAVFHYQPLHLSEMGRKFGGRPGDCPVTESVADRLVRLPFYNDLSESEQGSVIEAVATFRP